MKLMYKLVLILFLITSVATNAQRSKKQEFSSKDSNITSLNSKAHEFQGFFDFYYEDHTGKVFLKVAKVSQVSKVAEDS